MFINPINVFRDFVIMVARGVGTACTPVGYFGCDVDKCVCDQCGNSTDICWTFDKCIYHDDNTHDCHTTDICSCYDNAHETSRADLTGCSSCDSGPPEDTCTTNDKCTTGGATMDWVNCGFLDWQCSASGYGADAESCSILESDICWSVSDVFCETDNP